MDIVDEKTIFSNESLAFKEYEVQYDNQFKTKKHYLEFSNHSVTIIAITSDNRFLLIRQNRFGQDGFVWEFPAGGIEDRETPEEAARRELLEETGTKGKITSLGMFNAFAGVCNLKSYVFVATELTHNLAWQNLEGYEEIIVDFKTKDEIFQLINDGKIADSYLLSSLMMYLSKSK